MKKLILVALNEFDPAFFALAAGRADLPHIRRLLASPHSTTWTADEREKHGLDPWVQWVSIHTGRPSQAHGIRHLGDVPQLDCQQIWEALSAQGISSGIWGAMNASRGRADNCRFFLPDPWTFSERAWPEPLNDLLALPRYYSTNYLDTSPRRLLAALGRLVRFVVRSPGLWGKLVAMLPLSLRGLLRFGARNHLLFSLFDLVSVTVFLEYKKRLDPDFALVFINSIAHMQHNIWSQEGTIDAPCLYTLQVIDRLLGRLFEEGSDLLVVNALTQRNIAGRKRAIVYRQVNPVQFVTALGLPFRSVEQLMTNDAHILFDRQEDALRARDALAGATLNGHRLFDVDYDPAAPCKLFYQLDCWDELPADTVFELGGRSFRFFDHFEKVVARTGEHLPGGDVYARGVTVPDRIPNHRLYDCILGYYGCADAAGRTDTAGVDAGPRPLAVGEGSVA